MPTTSRGSDEAPHIPVMEREVIKLVSRAIEGDDPRFVDATLGAGGHTMSMLREHPQLSITAFDQDPSARAIASRRLGDLACRVEIVPKNFSSIGEELAGKKVRGVLFDLGVSNMQITIPERGFSFQDDGPLDMRMNADGDAPTADDLLSTMDLAEMSSLFKEYGEERFAFQIARGIVRARERGEMPHTTAGIVELIRRILPAPVQRKMGGHPARRVFQALRIAVNGEIDALREGLEGAISICASGAVIIAISYHSLEDRIVKHRFKEWMQAGLGRVESKRPIVPSDEEIEINRRSRSAKLRAFWAA